MARPGHRRRRRAVGPTLAAVALAAGLAAAATPSGALGVLSGYKVIGAAPAFGTDSSTSTIAGMSCPSVGNCSVAGNFVSTSGHLTGPLDGLWVADQHAGAWGAPMVVSDASVARDWNGAMTAISCSSPGNCAAGGMFTGAPQRYDAFVIQEVHGTWGPVQFLTSATVLNAGNNATVTSISCPSDASCTAVGTYLDASDQTRTFTADESGGVWGTPSAVTGTGDLAGLVDGALAQVSCSSAGECLAVGLGWANGTGTGQAIAVEERSATWQAATALPGTLSSTSLYAQAKTVSCAAGLDCAIGGWYRDPASHDQGFVEDVTAGVLQPIAEVPGLATLNVANSAWVTDLSCPGAGSCAGYLIISDGVTGYVPYAISETAGTWGAPVATTGKSAADVGNGKVACASAGNCALVGTVPITTSIPRSNAYTAFIDYEVAGHWQHYQLVSGPSAAEAAPQHTGDAIACAAPTRCELGGTVTPQSAAVNGAWVGDELRVATPSAPRAPRVARARGRLAVSWLPPASNGGAAVVQYRVVASPTGRTCVTTGRTCTFGGLSTRVRYRFRVAARNVAGFGPLSGPTAPASPL